jgi:hypothetical protein
MDSQFVSDTPKFVAGCLSALSSMVQLELPHINLLTKMDLCKDKVRVSAACAKAGRTSRRLRRALALPVHRNKSSSTCSRIEWSCCSN